MQKVAFYNSKGGTGKTTLSGAVANEIEGLRVVLIDMDVQANLTGWLITEGQPWELADVLSKKTSLETALVEIRPGLSILPTLGAVGDLQQFVDAELVRRTNSVRFLFEDLANFADIVVCDMSPSSGLLERYVLMEMDHVIVPMSAAYFGISGVGIVEKFLADIREESRTSIDISAIALNMVNHSIKDHVEVENEARQLRYPLFVIPQDVRLAAAQFDHTFETKSRSHPFIWGLAQVIVEEAYAR